MSPGEFILGRSPIDRTLIDEADEIEVDVVCELLGPFNFGRVALGCDGFRYDDGLIPEDANDALKDDSVLAVKLNPVLADGKRDPGRSNITGYVVNADDDAGRLSGDQQGSSLEFPGRGAISSFSTGRSGALDFFGWRWNRVF